jgi:hypothetical protein
MRSRSPGAKVVPHLDLDCWTSLDLDRGQVEVEAGRATVTGGGKTSCPLEARRRSRPHEPKSGRAAVVGGGRTSWPSTSPSPLHTPARRLRRRHAASAICIALVISLCLAELGFVVTGGGTGGGYLEIDDAVDCPSPLFLWPGRMFSRSSSYWQGPKCVISRICILLLWHAPDVFFPFRL